MYAILSQGGHQYRVAPGDRLLVDRLPAEVGAVVALEPVILLQGEDGIKVGEGVDGARVAATVVAHRRGPKLRIFKYKPKKRYRRTMGHRSDLTELVVEALVARGDPLPAATERPTSRRSVARADLGAGAEDAAEPATVRGTKRSAKATLATDAKTTDSPATDTELATESPATDTELATDSAATDAKPATDSPATADAPEDAPAATEDAPVTGPSKTTPARKTKAAGPKSTTALDAAPDADADSAATKNDDEA